MIDAQPTFIHLKEYEPQRFPCRRISDRTGEILWRKYSNQVLVDFPCPKTDGQWQLTAQGWVGYIPLSQEDVLFVLQPKVQIGNIFRMLEYAYNLRLHFPGGLVGCQSLAEFYERLANVLAKRVLDRGRKGFYRTYLPETEDLPYIRGRLNLRRAIRAPWETRLQCCYEEHTSDVQENQILAWTLSCIARSGLCGKRVIPAVRQAYRALLGFASLVPCGPQDCVGRLYTRLNEDYHPLHALCRFFLEHSGPSHRVGQQTMLPFLIDMWRLYELFVAEWLRAHLPTGLVVRRQEKVYFGDRQELRFDVDLSLYGVQPDKILCVLDTKYKAPELGPSQDDISQVVTYAEAKRCREAVLIYPAILPSPLDVSIGDIHVRSLTFSLDGDLDEAGHTFLQDLRSGMFEGSARSPSP